MFRLLPRKLPSSLAALTPLALDLRWTWSHAGDELWREIDADAWQRTRNPWFLLQDIPQLRLEQLAVDGAFRDELERIGRERDEYMNGPSWFAANGARLRNERVGYFSMEFGLGEAIPLYAGGLGILAGDYLKTASDLGLPVVGVGILFQEGYFRQTLDAKGAQHEAYPYNDPSTLPIQPVSAETGGWLRVPVGLPGRTVFLRVWRANVGRVDLYLLDTNDPLNSPTDRGITSKLYGGDPDTRLLQEIVLGIGGWRALRALGLEPTIAHLNEGHAAFVVLERARSFMRENDVSFREALWATRAGNVFTTHTPVAAGFDAFEPERMAKHFPPFGEYLARLTLSSEELLALGRRDPRDAREPFNMARLALRGCARTNGVSRLHGAVSRALFQDLFPRWPEQEVPIDSVTNGVHVPTWDSRAADALWTEACGKRPWSASLDRLCDGIAKVGDETLWRMRSEARADLVSYTRGRLGTQLVERGQDPSSPSSAVRVLEPAALTLGFARRFAEYKRPDLLLRQPGRLVRLLNDPARPVQLVLAGKAHPADENGKRMIAEWIAFVNQPEVRHRAVFLEDYDIDLAERLVAGVDVWINTPRRPWEACGTSGMKVLANGGLNVSELDGWWAEAYAPDLGWALGEGKDPQSDARDVDDLYALLEERVVPLFYERDEHGIPKGWVGRIRASMSRLAPTFSSHRMALEYVDRLYVDAGEAFHRRAADGARVARSLSQWEATLALHWGAVRIEECTASIHDGARVFRATVHLGEVPPDAVRVELFANSVSGEPPFRQAMTRALVDPASGRFTFEATIATSRAALDFTPRIVAYHPEARIPAEAAFIAWGR
jgi:starch phosphorylase